MKKYVIVSIVVILVVGAIFLVKEMMTIYTIMPGAPYNDPVKQQAQAKTRLNTGGEDSVGRVWLGESLKTIESVEVEGAKLSMYILTSEEYLSSGGNRGHHVLVVYIERTDDYIDEFVVRVNGQEYVLTRKPKQLSDKLFGSESDPDDVLIGLRSWSNKWFKINFATPPPTGPMRMTDPPGTVVLQEGEEYASRTEQLPYEVGRREIVSWPAADPNQVIVTTMDETVKISKED